MIAKILTTTAETCAMRYAALCSTWQSAFDHALNDKHFGYADHPGNVAKGCYVQAEAFLADEREHIDRIIEEIASDAHQKTLQQLSSEDSAELPAAALDHLAVTAAYLADELIAQIHRDIAMVRQAVQRAQLDVYTNARARRIPERQSLIEYRISNSDHLNFMFHDRHARKWSSKKFVRGLWRHTLLSVYNETVMIALADHGLERAGVYDTDQGHQIQIASITLTGATDLDGYADVRSDYFHPNSSNFLGMETHSV